MDPPKGMTKESFVGPYFVSLYTRPPINDFMEVAAFQECAVARMAVLQALDRRCGLDQKYAPLKEPILRSEIHKRLVEAGLAINMPISVPPPMHAGSKSGEAQNVTKDSGSDRPERQFTPQEVKKRDTVSHFILRLACVRDRHVVLYSSIIDSLAALSYTSDPSTYTYNAQWTHHSPIYKSPPA